MCVILSSDRSLVKQDHTLTYLFYVVWGDPLCNSSKYWCFKCLHLLVVKGLHTCHHPWALWWWTVVSLQEGFGEQIHHAHVLPAFGVCSSAIRQLPVLHELEASVSCLCCHSFRSWQFVIPKKWWESVSDFTEPRSFLLDKCVLLSCSAGSGLACCACGLLHCSDAALHVDVVLTSACWSFLLCC